MYRAALPIHWVLAQIMNNANVPPHSFASFFTGCADLMPMLGAAGLATATESATDASRLRRDDGSFSPGTSRAHVEARTSAPSSRLATLKRHSDVGDSRSNAMQNESNKGSRTKMKRRSDTTSRKDVGNSPHPQPPNKKPMLRASSPRSKQGDIRAKSPKPSDSDQLSEDVWATYHRWKQTDEMFHRKMRLYDAIYHILKSKYPYCRLHVVGSSMTGFGCKNSDMDLCLMLTDNEIDQRSEATTILGQVYDLFKNCNFVHKMALIKAKVPILKFCDKVSGTEVDFNVNNTVGIRNTHMLKCYSKMDWRVSPLVLIVKLWAKEQNINDAKLMTISSYSIVLMVINFLQCGVKPPVLPCLHKLYPGKFCSESDIHNLNLNEELPTYRSLNNMSLGELLLGFLDYYSNEFIFPAEAVSVRTGARLPKITVQMQRSRKNNPGQWKFLCIEEPFDFTNTARSVYDEQVFHFVTSVFKTSWQRLQRTKRLNCILSY